MNGSSVSWPSPNRPFKTCSAGLMVAYSNLHVFCILIDVLRFRSHNSPTRMQHILYTCRMHVLYTDQGLPAMYAVLYFISHLHVHAIQLHVYWMEEMVTLVCSL